MKNKILLDIVKKAILSKFEDIDLHKDNLSQTYPELNEQKATFVTLKLDGKLRACMGSLIAHRTLYNDLIYNARAAAFSDPRFSPLSKEEFEKIDIEISILSKAKPLEYSDFEDLENKLIPNKHGVIIELEGKRATFLPQVWEELPTFSDFMVHLCQKAGLNPSNLPAFPNIWIYETSKTKSDDEI